MKPKNDQFNLCQSFVHLQRHTLKKATAATGQFYDLMKENTQSVLL